MNNIPGIVKVVSTDGSFPVNAVRFRAATRSIEGREGAIARAQEAMGGNPVLIVSRNLSPRVNGCGQGVKRARRIEGGEAAVACAKEAVSVALRVNIGPRDHASPANAPRYGIDGAGRIEGGDRAVASAQKAVGLVVRVIVVSSDGSFAVDAVGLGEGRAGRIESDVSDFLSSRGEAQP